MSATKKLQQRKAAQSKLDKLFERRDTVVVIHYSCESFYNREEGTSSRITSIAVRNLENAQTVSFSIHFAAERSRVAFTDIEDNYDKLEKDMLDDFYEYVKMRDIYQWLHWNMRNSNYGFYAIAHRYRVLRGKPYIIPEAQLHDLAVILPEIYGPDYAKHPRMQSTMKMNHITEKDFLTGSEEAAAFEDKKYLRLHQSTLRKVDVISEIAERAWRDELKTNMSKRELYGLNIEAWTELVKDHWIISLLGIVMLILGLLKALGLL